jgi:pimeloyl-ACP methyl ester carboxylesterase
MKTWIDPHSRRSLQYWDVGQGPPLVLLHAFPLTHEMWQPQVQSLSERWRLVLPNVWGFSGSTPASNWTVDTYADDLAHWLESLGLTAPIHLGGLSMGGYVALAFARRHPQKLASLILADTRSEADSTEAQANRDQAMAFVRERGVREFFEQKMLPKVLAPESPSRLPELPGQLLAMAESIPVEAVVAALQALKTRPDATPGLCKIAVPTLVLCGAADAITPPSLSQAMAQAIPGARLELIPEAGHLANLEAPAEFNAAVVRFLNFV